MIEDVFLNVKFNTILRKYAEANGINEDLIDDFISEVYLYACEKNYHNEKQVMKHATLMVKRNSSFWKKYKYEQTKISKDFLSTKEFLSYLEED